SLGGEPRRLSEFPSRISSNETTSLFDDQFLVRRLLSQFVDLSTRPPNDNRIDSRRHTQSEMDPRVARTLKAASRTHFCIASRSLDRDLDLRAEAIAVRFAADGLDA